MCPTTGLLRAVVSGMAPGDKINTLKGQNPRQPWSDDPNGCTF